MIHVCFSLHDKTGRYSKFTGTTILSVFENTNSDVTAHILHDNTLTQENRDKFIYLAGRYGQVVKFYNVEELCAEKISEMIKLIPAAKTSRLSVAALYRLLIPQLLPADIDKCIYLDSDIAVNLDINELWQINLGDKPLAAADEMRIDNLFYPITFVRNYLITEGFVDYHDYFNSGVLLTNLKILRGEEETIMHGVKFVGEHPQLLHLDQDVLNYLYSKNYLKLDEKFNSFVRKSRHHPEKINRKIYHFAGAELKIDITDLFNRLWMHYFIKSPWFDENTIGRLYSNFQQVHIELKNSMIKLSAAMSGKTRAFITVERELRKLVETFSVRNDEEIIIVADSIHVNKIIEKIYSSHDEKIFFILLPNFPLTVLTEEGLVQGKDFFNAYDFLLKAQDISRNSRKFIETM